jgi:predicted DCC family thiol-disulfide oxidoreductase YuxK
MKADHKFTVLYDGGCPLCSREIGHYRRLSGAADLHWVDAALADADLSPFGVTRLDALRTFHVIDRQGEMHRGAWAFMALWAEFPRYRWLAKVCRWLKLENPLDWLYARFAAWHFRRRCGDRVCGPAGE